MDKLNLIKMVDLGKQYLQLRKEIDLSIQRVIDSTSFIGGAEVQSFSEELAKYLDVKHVIPCANGTDALQISLMALNLNKGDEIIVPSFTYAASAEAIALLGLKPVFVDVDPFSFNITRENCEHAFSNRTKAIISVHLFGQSCDMEALLAFAQEKDLFIIEDNAQAMGAEYTFSDGRIQKTGTMGNFGCTSFFPSKNLGCYGDGGAIMTNDDDLATKARMISNHGQRKKYEHEIIGCNSRLDSIQAAILRAKLPHLDQFNKLRREVALQYSVLLKDIEWLSLPFCYQFSTHVFHQYTLKAISQNVRDRLRMHLSERGISSMIYYPMPLHQQLAFRQIARIAGPINISDKLSQTVISIPIYPEMTLEELQQVVDAIKDFDPAC